MPQESVTNILIVGVGGQGTLLTSKIIADVAVALGYDVKVSEIHGMAQRGGSVVSQVRYGDKVYSPIVSKGEADVILAFEKLEAARWLDYLKPQGLLIINDERVDPLPVLSGKAKYPLDIIDQIKKIAVNTIVVDASVKAREAGNIKTANVVLVGVLSQAIQLPEDEMTAAIKKSVPAGALEQNLQAFQAGVDLYAVSVAKG